MTQSLSVRSSEPRVGDEGVNTPRGGDTADGTALAMGEKDHLHVCRFLVL